MIRLFLENNELTTSFTIYQKMYRTIFVVSLFLNSELEKTKVDNFYLSIYFDMG